MNRSSQNLVNLLVRDDCNSPQLIGARAFAKARAELKAVEAWRTEARDPHSGKWTDSGGSSASGWGDIGDLPPVKEGPTALKEDYRHEADVAVPGADAPSLDSLPADAYDDPSKFMDKFNPMLGTNYHGLAAYKETLATLRKARGNPNAMITIYRGGVPGENGINSGDWVTPSRRYAEAIQSIRGGGIVAATVSARTVHWGGKDLNEFGYHGSAPTTRRVT